MSDSDSETILTLRIVQDTPTCVLESNRRADIDLSNSELARCKALCLRRVIRDLSTADPASDKYAIDQALAKALFDSLPDESIHVDVPTLRWIFKHANKRAPKFAGIIGDYTMIMDQSTDENVIRLREEIRRVYSEDILRGSGLYHAYQKTNHCKYEEVSQSDQKITSV